MCDLLLYLRYETFWPVFCKDVHGVVMVYNPGNSKHEKEIEKWYNNYAFNYYNNTIFLIIIGIVILSNFKN